MKRSLMLIAMLALAAQSRAEVTQQAWLGYRGFMSGRDARNRSGAVLTHYLEAGLSRNLFAFSQLDYQALDRSFEERNSYVWNNLSAGLRWMDDHSLLKLEYRNRYYVPGKTLQLAVTGVPGPTKQRMVNNAFITARREADALTFSGWGQLRNLRYNLYDSSGEAPSPQQENDLWYCLRVDWKVSPPLYLFAGGLRKDDRSDVSNYSITQDFAGAGLDKKFDPFTMLQIEFGFYSNQSPALKAYRRNYLLSGLRLVHRFGTNLAAFIRGEHRAGIEPASGRVKTISYLLRNNLTYTYKEDAFSDSYVTTVVKISQRATSATGLQVKQQVLRRLFAEAGYHYYYGTRGSRYLTGIYYYVNPADYLYVSNEHYRWPAPPYQNMLTAGLSFGF